MSFSGGHWFESELRDQTPWLMSFLCFLQSIQTKWITTYQIML